MTSPIYEEEVFGPVVIVNTFREEEEAIREANSVEYGLFCMSSWSRIPKARLTLVGTAAVFTQNFERALRVSKRLESGAVGVNCSMPIRALDMPIGGWKQSGIGAELAIHGLNAFTELKSIYMRFSDNRDKAGGLPYNWHNGAWNIYII
jgi:aldehyde dehydrogenase (NAD+)